MADPTFPLPHIDHDLSGQVALVTGASSGLGWRFSQVLANAGATVIAGARRVDKLEALAATIGDAGGTCRPVALDVTDADQIVTVLDDVCANEGVPQILVNNAGMPVGKRAHRMSLELIDLVIATNLRGPFFLATQLAGRLIDAGLPGRIVNISSMASVHFGVPGESLYSMTKAGLNRMTEVLSVEWARNDINVNGIAPGAFASEMVDKLMERVGDQRHLLPRERIGHPAQLDSTLLFLVSPASEMVTGTTVLVDDGQNPR